MVAQDSELAGIGPSVKESIKFIQYAADINVTLKISNDIRRFLEHLYIYELASGATVKNPKSEIMSPDDGVPTEWNFWPVRGT